MRPDRFALTLAGALVLAGCSSTGTSTSSNGLGTVKKESAATQRQEAARVNVELGQRYMAQGKLEIAMEKLTRALEFDASFVDAHTVIAVLYEQIRDPAQAGVHYKRAVELKPRGGNENNNYGWFLCRQAQYAEAMNYFQRALADPFYQTPTLAESNMAICKVRAGDKTGGEQALRRVLERDPNDAEALLALAGILYDKGDHFNARAFFQRYEGAAAPTADALMLGRNIELRLGNATGVKDYTRKLLQGFPESEQARKLSGKG